MRDDRYSTNHAGPAYVGWVVLCHTIPVFRDGRTGHWFSPGFQAVYIRVIPDVEDPISEFQRLIRSWPRPVIDKLVQLDTADGFQFGKSISFRNMTRDKWPHQADFIGRSVCRQTA
jgi:hypothetical protein